MTELHWRWIALMLTAPPVVGVLLAYPVWRKRETILGNLLATSVILAAAFSLILRESVELRGLAQQCLDAGYVCWPAPTAFVRYAIYAGIGILEVFAVFVWSLRVEQRIRSRDYAPEWR